MKVNIPAKPVESSGVKSQGEFRIKNSAKAFSILSSGLYSNKHQAILRELGCNAYDSHVEAGKGDVPFTVHLPTRLNPTFFVRDYGIGLDHQGVVDIYTTYFESTKQDSNNYVGCMGLGSKSPFSYTDNFSITAIKDGTRRLYSAFINEEGIPSIALMHEEETDEDNGVEVSFAVNDRHDMYRFREEAANVYKWFKTKPEITGEPSDILEIEYAEKNIIPGVHIRNTENSYRNGSYALMGNVAYPIKLEETEDETDESKRKNQIRDMYNNGGLVVEFNIGDLDIAASREELSYIPHTMNSIYQKGEEIFTHLGIYIEKELSVAKTKWERMQVLNRLMKSNKYLFSPAITAYIKNNSRKFFKYTRLNYYGATTYFALDDFKSISKDLKVSYYDISKRYADNVMVAHRVKVEHICKDEDDKNSDHIQVYKLDVENVTVVMQDDRGGMLPRIKAGVLDKTIDTRRVLAFRITSKDANKDEIYKKVRRLLGNPNIVWTSSLPKTNTTHVKNKKLAVYCFNEGYGRSYRDQKYTFKLEADVSNLPYAKGKKHIYIPLRHKSVDFGDNVTMSPDEFAQWIKSKCIDTFLDIRVKDIYGINKTTRKLIKGNKEWINFFDLFRKEFNKIDWSAAKEDTRRKYIRRVINNGDYNLRLCRESRLVNLKNNNTPFGRLVEFYLDNKTVKETSKVVYDRLIIAMKEVANKKAHKMLKDLDKLMEDLNVNTVESDVQKILTEVGEKYPMLTKLNLNSQWKREDWDYAYDYILLVDSTL